jgi:hypothetical protein
MTPKYFFFFIFTDGKNCLLYLSSKCACRDACLITQRTLRMMRREEQMAKVAVIAGISVAVELQSESQSGHLVDFFVQIGKRQIT